MSKKRPEWAPDADNKEFTTSVMPPTEVEAIPTVTRIPILRKELTSNDYIEGVLRGDRVKLAQTITLIESNADKHKEMAQQVLKELYPQSGKSIRIGITGVPGVGKSSFIEKLGMILIQEGHKVAVLAVDPSSPLHGGSILGDKTRMEELTRIENAFIRPSPSAGALGGVAQKTRETMLACEAAGYDIVLIETVGVGQSEVEVFGMVDFFLVLMLPNAGDELQGIKKGILELAHAIVINKADSTNRESAELSKNIFESALYSLFQHSLPFQPTSWKTPVMLSSAREATGILDVWIMVKSYIQKTKEDRLFISKRAEQNQSWFRKLLLELVEQNFKTNTAVAAKLPQIELEIQNGVTTPYLAANELMATFKA